MLSYEKNLLEFRRQFSPENFSFSNLGKLRGARPDGIVICGMGGSGLPGLILEKLAGELKIPAPVASVRDESLPKTNFKRPLFIIVSFSGETAETIKNLKSALRSKNRAGVAVVAGGGKLEALAKKHKLPLVLIEKDGLIPLEIARPAGPSGARVSARARFLTGLTPREASGTMFLGIVRVLEAVFPLRTSPLKGLRPLHLRSFGNLLARAAKNRNILIYTDYSFAHLGYIWKINLNETAKIPAFTGIYPELNHNEIAGFEKAKGEWAIFWLKEKSSAALSKKINLISKIIGSKVKSIAVPLEGRNMQEKTWNSIVLSHWTAFYLAKFNKIDPRKTRIIDELKKRVK